MPVPVPDPKKLRAEAKRAQVAARRDTSITWEGTMDPIPVPGDTTISLLLDWTEEPK